VTSETTQALFEVARLIGAGIVGGLIATYAGHLLTARREQHSERRHRKREFRSFVVRLRSDAAAPPLLPNLSRQQAFAAFYREEKRALRCAAADVENDFASKLRAEFDRLLNTATEFTGEELTADNGKKRVDDALAAILRFIDR
jgi:hypothetical protein